MAFGRPATMAAGAAAGARVDERVSFIRRTYSHLAGAIALFVLLEAVLLQMPFAQRMTEAMFSSPMSWLLVLGGFMLIGWFAEKWARSGASPGMQYLGLGLYVVAEAVIFVPLLFIASRLSDPTVIPTAGLLTLTIFAGLTGTVFITRKDFSFMRGFLMVAAFAALGAIVAGAIFGFSLGLWFSVAMVLVAGGYVLYYTSNVLFHYRTDQHVAASLALCSAIALLFWYILRVVMELARD